MRHQLVALAAVPFWLALVAAPAYGQACPSTENAGASAESSRTTFGTALGRHCPLKATALNGDDYGLVSLVFEPSPAVIPMSLVNSTWLKPLGNGQARSAEAVAEVVILQPGKRTDNRVVANIPLFRIAARDSGGKSIAMEQTGQSFLDRVAVAPFLLRSDTQVRVTISLRILGQDPIAGSSVMMATFGLGFDESKATTNRIDFTATADALPTNNKPGAGVSLGTARFALERRPSVFSFVRDTLPNGIPDYGMNGNPGMAQISRFLTAYIPEDSTATAPGAVVSPGAKTPTFAQYLARKVKRYDLLCAAGQSVADFEATVREVVGALSALEISSHDRFVTYHAVLLQKNCLSRPDLRATATIRRDLPSFRSYALYVPPADE